MVLRPDNQLEIESLNSLNQARLWMSTTLTNKPVMKLHWVIQSLISLVTIQYISCSRVLASVSRMSSLIQSDSISIERFLITIMKLLTSQSKLSTVQDHLDKSILIPSNWYYHKKARMIKVVKQMRRFLLNHSLKQRSSRSSDLKMISTTTYQLTRMKQIHMRRWKHSRDTSVTWSTSILKTWHMLPNAERKPRD